MPKSKIKLMSKPSLEVRQDNTSSKNIYRTNSSSNEGGFKGLKKSTKAATAALGLLKAIPSPLTQRVPFIKHPWSIKRASQTLRGVAGSSPAWG